MTADCSCPWRDSETPCIEHSHFRVSRTGDFYCVSHEHRVDDSALRVRALDERIAHGDATDAEVAEFDRLTDTPE